VEELIQLVVRLIEVRSQIAALDKPQPYMLKEVAELEKEVMSTAIKLDKRNSLL